MLEAVLQSCTCACVNGIPLIPQPEVAAVQAWGLGCAGTSCVCSGPAVMLSCLSCLNNNFRQRQRLEPVTDLHSVPATAYSLLCSYLVLLSQVFRLYYPKVNPAAATASFHQGTTVWRQPLLHVDTAFTQQLATGQSPRANTISTAVKRAPSVRSRWKERSWDSGRTYLKVRMHSGL